MLDEFNLDRKSTRALVLEQMMAAVGADSLNEQVAKFNVIARLRGDFSSATVRPPCKPVSQEEVARIESSLAQLAYL